MLDILKRLVGIDPNATADKKPQGGKLDDGIFDVTMHHPGESVQLVRAKISESSARGFVWLNSASVYDLFDQIWSTFPAARSALQTLLDIMASTPLVLKTQDPEVKDLCDRFEPMLRHVLNTHFLRNMHIHGNCNVALTWDLVDGFWIPVGWTIVHPGKFCYEPVTGIQRWYEKGLPGDPVSPLAVVHGNLPDTYNSGVGESIFWALRFDEEDYRAMRKSRRRSNEMAGLPLVHGKIPRGSADFSQQATSLLGKLKGLLTQRAIVTAEDTTIEITDSSGKTNSSGLTQHDVAIADDEKRARITILGSELAQTTGANGNLSLGKEHAEATKRRITIPCECATRPFEDLINMVVEINLGKRERVLYAYDTELDEAAADVRERLTTAKEIGLPIVVDTALDMLGLPKPMTGDVLIQSFSEQVATQARALSATLEQGRLNAAKAAKIEAQSELDRAIKASIEALRRESISDDMPITTFSPNVVAASDLEEPFRRICAAAALMARYEYQSAVAGVKDKRSKFRKVEELPELFADALAWMDERNILTTAALKAMAKTFADQADISIQAAETLVRNRALALANATSIKMADEINQLIRDAVESGTTLRDFENAMTSRFGLRGGYVETIFRTEIANAYAEQQRAQEDDIRDYLWGYEYTNPADERSRPGHAALNGKRFKLGSVELDQIGWPPFDYSCRCARFPLVAPDVNKSGYRPSRAQGLADGIERFG